MLISHQHRFIFIHVHKSAGNSISAALEQYCEGTSHELHDAGFPLHASAALICKLVGSSIWDSYFKFAIERNPWDKVLSSYYYQMENWERFRKWYRHPCPTFEQWMYPFRFWRKSLAPSFPMYSIRGCPAVDFVGRYESLEQDFAFICESIGLPQIRLPMMNRSALRPTSAYREAYTRRTRRRVADTFYREIEHFGYAF